MLIQENFLKKLRSAFNLNIYEVKIWTALLSKGMASAGELSDISDVPRSRAYDVLESLEKRGFIVMKLGKPIKYLAINPEEVIKRVKKSFVERANEQVDLLETIGKDNFFNELTLLYKNGINHIDPANISGAIKGRKNLHNHIETMLRNAQKSVVIVTSSSGLIRKADQFSHILRKLNDKKIDIKIAAPLNDEGKKVAERLKNFAKVKDIDLNARFVLVDKKELIFMINDDNKVHESYDIGIWANSEMFTKALSNMFDSAWKGVQ